MKKTLYSLLLLLVASSFMAQAQEAAVKIDGKVVYLKSGNSLPYWLSAGQTIAPSKNVSFLSGIEFSSDSTNHVLKYDQVIKIASLNTVPAGKAWKIEAIAYDTLISTTSMGAVMMPSGSSTSIGSGSSSTSNTPVLYKSPKVFDVAGSYQWMVPPGVTSICIEAWGGGGNGGYGGGSSSVGYGSGGGGGGGGYGYQCFSVTPGTVYNLTVGGAGGSTTFGVLMTSYGGAAGDDFYINAPNSAIGGLGGSSTGLIKMNGVNGLAGWSNFIGINVGKTSAGGAAYLGGVGGTGLSTTCAPGSAGTAPGGGGSGGGGGNLCGSQGFGVGAPGRLIIYW